MPFLEMTVHVIFSPFRYVLVAHAGYRHTLAEVSICMVYDIFSEIFVSHFANPRKNTDLPILLEEIGVADAP